MGLLKRQKHDKHSHNVVKRVANFQTLQTFLLLFYMLITKTFLHIPSNFDSILQNNSVTIDKNKKNSPTQLAPPVPGQAYDLQ